MSEEISAFNLAHKRRLSCSLSGRRQRWTKSPLGSSGPLSREDPSGLKARALRRAL